jgi:hypothetical protein
MAVTGVGAVPAIIYHAACSAVGSIAAAIGYDQFKDDLNNAVALGTRGMGADYRNFSFGYCRQRFCGYLCDYASLAKRSLEE